MVESNLLMKLLNKCTRKYRVEDDKVLDGRHVSNLLLEELTLLTKKICGSSELASGVPRMPGFAIIQVGDNTASNIYIANKKRVAESLGFYCAHYHFDQKSDPNEIGNKILELNLDSNIDGIIIQLPLEDQFKHLLYLIAPQKDIDGLGYIQQARLSLNIHGLRPCTPLGVIALLKFSNIALNQHFCVVGRSVLVGQSLALMLLHENATVTVVHSKTQNIAEHLSKADVVCLAAGVPEFIKPEWLTAKSIVIDIAISKKNDGRICGDLSIDAISKIWRYSPVPGGIGPMTIAALMANVMQAYLDYYQISVNLD